MSTKNDPRPEVTTRTKVIEWWDNIPFNSSNTEISKTHYANKYFIDRKYNSLTGREIESIYEKEHALCYVCKTDKAVINGRCPTCHYDCP